ncbi:MAG: alpha/beta hydrolase [Saprospiraceae bacterium]
MAKQRFLLFCLLFLAHRPFAQNALPAQDPGLNNLVHPKGYLAGKIGALGAVKKYGHAPKSMILLPGLGFGAEVFDAFIRHYKKTFTLYLITPAGFAGTPAPPMPDSAVTYAQLSWTNSLVNGILALMEKEKITRPVIVAHFVTATQVALQLAANHPDKIGKVIILSGSPYRYYPSQKNGQWDDWVNEQKLSPEQRTKLVEDFWAPQWFKTVTKKTWDDNMWTPDDYCRDPATGKQLFQSSAEVPLPVMIRYLLEWMAYDPNPQYRTLRTPTLVLLPDFKNLLTPTESSNVEVCKNVAAKQYLRYFHQVAWQSAKDSGNAFFQFQTVPDTRIFMWLDNPESVYQFINKFLGCSNY